MGKLCVHMRVYTTYPTAFFLIPSNPELPPLKHRLPLLLERLQSLIPILRPDHSQIHFIFLLLSRPSNRLQASPDGNWPSLANLPCQSHRLRESSLLRYLQDLCTISLILWQYFYKSIRYAEKVRFRGGNPATSED